MHAACVYVYLRGDVYITCVMVTSLIMEREPNGEKAEEYINLRFL